MLELSALRGNFARYFPPVVRYFITKNWISGYHHIKSVVRINSLIYVYINKWWSDEPVYSSPDYPRLLRAVASGVLCVNELVSSSPISIFSLQADCGHMISCCARCEGNGISTSQISNTNIQTNFWEIKIKQNSYWDALRKLSNSNWILQLYLTFLPAK